jgi:hypothetical protein
MRFIADILLVWKGGTKIEKECLLFFKKLLAKIQSDLQPQEQKICKKGWEKDERPAACRASIFYLNF